MSPSLTCMLQLFKYKALQLVIDIKIARHPHVGYKAKVDFVSGIVLLLDELFCLRSMIACRTEHATP